MQGHGKYGIIEGNEAEESDTKAYAATFAYDSALSDLYACD